MSIPHERYWIAFTCLVIFISAILMFGLVYRYWTDWGSVTRVVMFHWVIPIMAVLLIGELWFEYKQHQLVRLRVMILQEIKDEVERQGHTWGPKGPKFQWILVDSDHAPDA